MKSRFEFELKNSDLIQKLVIEKKEQKIILHSFGGKEKELLTLSKTIEGFRGIYSMNHSVNFISFEVTQDKDRIMLQGNLKVAFLILKAMNVVTKQLHHDIENIINSKTTDFFTKESKEKGGLKDMRLPNLSHLEGSKGGSFHTIPLVSEVLF